MSADEQTDCINLLKELPEGYLCFGADPTSGILDTEVWCAGWYMDGMGHWEFYDKDPYQAIQKAYEKLYGTNRNPHVVIKDDPPCTSR